MTVGRLLAQDDGSGGTGTVFADGSSVFQSVNGDSTLFCSDLDSPGTDVTGSFFTTDSDDDFIGFALGFAGPIGPKQ